MARPAFAASARPVVEAMEERVLHSADLAGLAIGSGTLATGLAQPAALAAQPQHQASATEIAFVDLSLPDAQGLVADLRQQQAAGRPIEVVTIGADQDGLAVISEALAGRSGIGAVHVLAHGSDGRLQLGASVLDAASLLQRAPEVAGWSGALAPGADLLLYGCDLAETAVGQSLVQDIAALTGADVAASTDPTGAAGRGGDWTLEYTTGGPIHAASAVSAAEQASWQGLMATYTVTSLADNGAVGTLRWAINQANARAGTDTIVFNVNGTITIGRANLGGPAQDENGNITGDFDITDSVNIVGNGSGQTVIDAAGRDRVFDVVGGSATLSGMTIQNGANAQGGGVRVAMNAALTLNDVVVQNNNGYGGSGKGGGIYSDGSLTLNRTRVQQNGDGTTTVNGAGIYVDTHGYLSANDAELSQNRAGNTDGGGIYVHAGATANLQRVTLADNSASYGAGVDNFGTFTGTNVTFSGNSATSYGGAAWTSGSFSLDHATVADNSAPDTGGVYALGSFTVSNSLFANNGGGNSHAPASSNGYNLSTDGTLGLSGPGDRNNTAVSLQGLANNGGVGRTRATTAGNPAVDAANPNDGVGTDQRGVSRSGRADIGAYELVSQPPTVTTIADQRIDEDRSTGALGFTIGDPDTNVNDLTVTVSSDNGQLLPASSLVLGGSGASRTITVTPPANANGRGTVTLSVSDGTNVTRTSFVVTVNPVNDAPTVGDYAASTNEDTAVSGQVQGADVDGDRLTYSKGSDPSHGSVTVQADGRWTYAPAANYNGADSFTVLVDDGNGGRATSTIRLNVAAVNDAPTVPDYAVTTNEDTAVSGQVQGADVDGDRLTYSRGSDPAHGSVTVQADGRWTYTPAANYNGADSFTVLVDDGNGGRATSTIRLNVAAVNDAPTVPDYAVSTNEDTAVSGQVQGADVDGDRLTYSKGSDPSHGSVTVQADGRWTYAPAANYNGADSFTVLVDDGNGGRATSTIRLNVAAVNDPPTVPDYTVVTVEGVALTAQVTGVDVDGDTLTYAKGRDPQHGVVVVAATGVYVYTPALNYSGPDQFTVVVSDGRGGTAVSTVTIDVGAVNDAPTVPDYASTTAEETPVSGQVQGTDADGDTLSYAKGSDPRSGSVVVGNDGRWTYTPNRDFNGSDSFTVVVSDGNGGTATSTVRLTVTPVNDAPTVPDYAATTAEDTPVSGQVQGADVDGDRLTYSKASDPAHGSVTVQADGRWTYTPSQDFNGSDSFTVLVDDGNGGQATSTVRLTVTPVNDAPTVPDYTATTAEDTALSGQVQGADVEGDTLSYAKGSDPRSGSVVVGNDGRWTYTPNRDFNGSDSFTVVVSDGNGGTATSTVRLTVTPVNDAPTVPDYTATTAEDTSVSGQVQGSDVDGDALSYAKGSDPQSGSVVVGTDGRWTYTPNPDFNGSDSFTVAVSDGNGGTATSTVRLTVTPVNDVSTVPDYTATTAEDTAVSGQVQGADVEGDTLSYAKGSDPQSGSVVVGVDGRWTYTPNQDFNGSDSFTVVVSDGNGGTATSTVRLTVTPVNDAPTVADYVAKTAEDTSVSGQVQGSDVDGDALSYAKASDPRSGSVVVSADGRWTYTPNPDFNGSDSFTVVVSDGNGGTATSTVRLTVTPVNDAPTVPDYTAATAEDTPVSGQVQGADVEGDTLGYAKASDPRSGSVVVGADGRWTYTPNQDFNGSDSFTVVVSDGNGGTATSTVRLTITPVNDAPTVPDYTATTPEDTAVSGQVQGADVEGDTLSYAKGSDPRSGSVVVGNDGRWTYTPNQDFNGSDSFTVIVSDGNGGTATSTVRLTITPVNDAPTVPDYAVRTGEDVVLTGQVSGSDVEGDTLSYAKGSDPQHGVVVVAATGLYVYTPALDYNGPDRFTVVVSDGRGGTAVSTITIDVGAFNDAPTVPDYAATTAEDTPASGQVQGADVDGDALTYAKAGDPRSGTVVVAADGRWTYTPNQDFNGSDSFTVLVDDGNGGTATSTVRLTVTPVNDPSLLQADTATTPEDTPVAGNVLANDSDVDDVLRVASFQVAGQSATVAGGTATLAGIGRFTLAADGQWQFTPDADWNGRVPQIGYTTTTGARSTLDITVTPVNDVPVMADLAASTDEDQALAGRIVATDVDGDALRYARASDPQHGRAVVASDGSFVYTPDTDFHGSDRFDVRVSDGQGGTALATVTIAVASVNDGPRAGALPPHEATAKQAFSYALPADAFTDADGDPLRYSATLADGAPLPAWLGIDAATGRLSGTAGEALAEPLLLRMRATDPQGLYADALMVLAVAPAPAEPVAPAQPEPPLPPLLTPPLAGAPLSPQPAPAAPAEAPFTPLPAPAASAEVAPPDLSGLGPSAFASLIVASPLTSAPAGGVVLSALQWTASSPPMLRLPMEAARWWMHDGSHSADVLPPALPAEAPGNAQVLRPMGIDEARRLLDEARQGGPTMGVLRLSTAGVGTLAASGLSIGYVFWLLRGGVLASAMLSALPAWQMIDPMPVMAASRNRRRPARGPVAPGEREVEKLFEGGQAPAANAPAATAATVPPAAAPQAPARPPAAAPASDPGAAA